MGLLDPEKAGNRLSKRILSPKYSVSVPWNAETKEKWQEHQQQARNTELDIKTFYPNNYCAPVSNYLGRVGLLMGKEDLRCLDFVKSFWRCASVVGKREINQKCFEEKQDMLECKYHLKSNARYNLIRREYIKQTGKEYHPDAPRAPMHIFPKTTTGRPRYADVFAQ